jgi:hypothetical protein
LVVAEESNVYIRVVDGWATIRSELTIAAR